MYEVSKKDEHSSQMSEDLGSAASLLAVELLAVVALIFTLVYLWYKWTT